MAKEKFLSQTEFLKTYMPGEQLVYYSESPFSKITDPEGIIFVATHWNPTTSAMNVTSGTAYVCREGDHESPFKFDVLSFQPNKNGYIDIFHVKPKEIGYHHTKSVPSFLTELAPNCIKDKISKVMRKFGSIT